MLVTRMLQPHDWPRLSETGCVVDQTWAARTDRGFVLVVEDGLVIVGTLFVFVTHDAQLHADGLWIVAAHRGRVAVLRALWRAARWAVAQLTPQTTTIPTEAAVWMRPSAQRHGVEAGV